MKTCDVKIVMAFLCLTGWIVLMSGCGSNPQARQSVQGEVTCDGTPIAIGSISFEPIDSQASQSRSGGEIRDGKYLLEKEAGLSAGEYNVSITAIVPTGRTKVTNGLEEEEVKQIVADEYNVRTTLKATVAAGQKNVFDFAVTGRPEKGK
ncbi:MAG: hypothetical protein Q4G68_02020 [Planctomycetia bacterium]|nr:hypothetical protein [Planctomycetia bacterium]